MTGPARAPRAPFDLRQQLGVETPEHVVLSLELAGLGTRAAAAVVDTLILSLAYLLLAVVMTAAAGSGTSGLGTWSTAVLLLIGGLGFFIYYAAFEALWDGHTPGKRLLGIRVVQDTGRPVTANAATVRNLLRIVDFLVPLGPLPGVLLVFLHPANKRLGDLAAGTVVVRERVSTWSLAPSPPPPPAAAEGLELGPPVLADQEFQLLDRFLARSDELVPEARRRFAAELVRRFEPRIPRRTADVDVYLLDVFESEQQRRRGRFATRAAGIGRTTVTAERFVARKRDRWEAFRTAAQQLGGRGLGHLPAARIPEFAAQYREVAADLARARTYGVDPPVVAYLERLVSAGHAVLYQARGGYRAPFLRYLWGDFPAAVIASWRYVLAAFLLFMIPAGLGFVMLRERPQLAEEIVPPVMVSRAEQAAEREAAGLGYARAESGRRPIIAAAIISNNILVCIVAFAGGMLAGLLTIWALIFNGLSIGMGFGVFANYHAAGYLATFVAGHGVLELTAIFISGGAGFRLAHALIAPGDRSRLDALVVDGRIAMQMVGAVVFLLAIAGSIEGLLSTSDAPAVWKFATSAASAVFLGAYLVRGSQFRRATGEDGRGR